MHFKSKIDAFIIISVSSAGRLDDIMQSQGTFNEDDVAALWCPDDEDGEAGEGGGSGG